jgi:hypothetical protein
MLCPCVCAEGDTLRTWRIDPFIMIEGGQAWVPPAMLAADIAAGETHTFFEEGGWHGQPVDNTFCAAAFCSGDPADTLP